jgi:predicted nucleotidyltransferase
MGTLSSAEHQAVHTFLARIRDELSVSTVTATVFGSRARGEGRPESDLDLLVVLERDDFATRRRIFDVAYEVYIETDIMIAPLVISRGALNTLKQSGRRLAREIERDGVPI